jgi:hypothetical protein
MPLSSASRSRSRDRAHQRHHRQDRRALALPDLFTRDPKQAAQLSKARVGAASALQRAEEDWLEASSQYDQAAG